jgi:hypothetical protein
MHSHAFLANDLPTLGQDIGLPRLVHDAGDLLAGDRVGVVFVSDGRVVRERRHSLQQVDLLGCDEVAVVYAKVGLESAEDDNGSDEEEGEESQEPGESPAGRTADHGAGWSLEGEKRERTRGNAIASDATRSLGRCRK